MKKSLGLYTSILLLAFFMGWCIVSPASGRSSSASFIKSVDSNTRPDNTPVMPPSKEMLSSYSVEVEFYPSIHYVIGWINVSFLNTESITLDEVYFHIWGNADPYNAVTIHAVFNGSNDPLKYVIYDQVNLVITITEGIPEGRRYSINIYFSVEFACESADRFGYVTEPHAVHAFGNWHPVLSVYEDGAWNQNPYAHSGEAFYTELAYYNVSITAPSGEIIAAGGDFHSVEIDGGKKTWHWTAGPIRDFTWVSSPDYQVSSMNHDGIDIYSYYFPEHEERGEIALDITKNSVDLFSELYDPWQYDTMVVVELQAWFGGMEYCQLVMISHNYYLSDSPVENFESVISHEWSHNWNTYMVGNNPWKEPWIDEGWAMYSSILYAERYHGVENAREVINYHKMGFIDYISYNIDRPLVTGMEFWEISSNYGYGIYIKGELVIDLLRYVMGDEAFFSSIQAFYDEYAYTTGVSTGDLQRVFEETSNQDLGWFFSQYIYNAGIPQYDVTSAEYCLDYINNEYIVWITIQQMRTTLSNKMPLKVTVELDYAPSKNYYLNMTGTLLNVELKISPAGFTPVRVILDADWMLIRGIGVISEDFNVIYTTSSSSSVSSGSTTEMDELTSTTSETTTIDVSSMSFVSIMIAIAVYTFRKKR